MTSTCLSKRKFMNPARWRRRELISVPDVESWFDPIIALMASLFFIILFYIVLFIFVPILPFR